MGRSSPGSDRPSRRSPDDDRELTRALDAMAEMGDRLVVAGTDVQAWQRALPQIIDIAVRNRRLLFVLERDEHTYAEILRDDPDLTTRFDEQQRRVSALFADPAPDTGTRIRLGCAVGAVLGPVIFFSDHYRDVPADDLRTHLRSAVTAVLDGPRPD